jgi:type IV pilus assembly protein PilM
MSLSILRKKTVVGIDLGHFAIRVAEVAPTANGWQVVRYGWCRTPEDSIRDGVVIDSQEVGAALRQLLRDSHIGTTQAAIAVGGGTIVVRIVRMPYMTEATLRKSIKFEASRYVPSSVEDSFIEFQILGKVEENQMEVMIVAAPRDIVNSRIAACEQAGLEVVDVDVEVFAAFRSLFETDPEANWNEKTFALVDIGASKTNMSVIRHGAFTMTRSFPHGSQHLTDALRQYFKLSPEESEQGKAQLDLSVLVDDSGPQENPPIRVIQPHVDDLVREIRRSMNYYQSQLAEDEQAKNVEMIVFTGGGAKLLGLGRYAEHKLKIPATALGVFQNPRFSYTGPGEAEGGQELSVVAGLAMRPFAGALSKAA